MKLSIFVRTCASDLYPSGGSFIFERLLKLKEKRIPFNLWVIQSKYPTLIDYLFYVAWNKKINANARLWNISQNEKIVIDRVNPLLYISSTILLMHYKHMAIKISKDYEFEDTTMIHSHWLFPTGYLGLLIAEKQKIPLVVTAHGSDIHTIPRKIPVIKKYTLLTLEKASKVIFVSNALLDSAMKLGYSGKNAIVIPNGINDDYFYHMTKKEAQEKTGWKQTHKYVVGFVGNLIQVKRADSFVYIFSEIQKRVSDVEFLIIGDGDLRENIKQGCKNCKIPVTFIGRVPHDNVGVWMNLFDVMLLPSRNEGWPCVVLEAYACGIPVIGSANGGIPEALGDLCPAVPDGDNFEIRFVDVVCDLLNGNIMVDKERLVNWALEHTWEKCVNREIEIYNEVLHSSSNMKGGRE